IQMPEQAGEKNGNVGLNDYFTMLGVEQTGNPARIGQLVVELGSGTSGESERLCFARLIGVLGHEGHHGARGDTAGEKTTDRHVAYHLHFDGSRDLTLYP